jgi:hypothetical protein
MAEERVAAKQPPYINGPQAEANSIACVERQKLGQTRLKNHILNFNL